MEIMQTLGKEAVAVVRPCYRKANKDGKFTLHLYVTYNGVEMDWGVKIYVTKAEWIKLRSENLRDDRLKEIKGQVKALELKAKRITREMGDSFTFEDFYTMFYGKLMRKSADKQNVLAAFDSKIKELDKDQVSTRGLYETTRDSLKGYCNAPVFKDITPDFLAGWEKYILESGVNAKSKKNSIATVGIYMRNLRHIMGRAVEDGVINKKQYPFGQELKGKYQIPTGKGGKSPLEVSDILKIMKYEPETKAQQYAFDLWFLMFECNGMNPTDVFNLKNGDIEGDFLRFYRQKTIRTRKSQEQVEIYLTPNAKRIIDRWRVKGGNANDYVFDIYNHSMDAEKKRQVCHDKVRRINDHMTRISKRVGVNKGRITTYVARHTWATYMEHNNVPLVFISKGLGHSSITTTTNYLADLNQDQKKDVSNLLDKLHQKAKPISLEKQAVVANA